MFIALKKGQASTQYNKAGMHLECKKLITTTYEASHPTLLKTELNEVKNKLFTVSKEHLNCLPLTKKTPLYRQLSTHSNLNLLTDVMFSHLAFNRGSNLMQTDLFTLLDISTFVSSVSQTFTRVCRPETDGAIN